jgi:CheY-like chemotaxis protein
MRVSTCASGREAVDLVGERQFDIILMDHMMPGMDGVEATRLIRAMSDERRRATPVIALTANAVSGMREMFLESGFNDFISKPIDTAVLDATLKRWIPEGKRRKALESREPPRPPEPPPAFPGIEGLDTAAGLARAGGSPSRYADLLELFLKDARAGLGLLERAPSESSLSPFTTFVHALKSALANIGAGDFSLKAASLERAGLDGDLERIRVELPLFRGVLVELAARLEASAAAPGPSGADAAVSDPGFGEALECLREALEGMDFDGMDFALERLRAMPLKGESLSAVRGIAELVLTADLEGALEAVKALAGRVK